MPLLGHIFQNALDVFAEAHIEHFVGLIENHHFHLAQFERVPLHVIHHTARRSHHNVGTRFERANLPINRVTSVDGLYPNTALVLRQFANFFGYLDSQFAGWTQNQYLHVPVVDVHNFESGNTKRGCFTRTRLRLTNYIATRHNGRDGFCLDRRG